MRAFAAFGVLVFGSVGTASAEDGMFAFDAEDGLPSAGTVAVGFNAAPFLNFGLNVVNIMNDTGVNADGLIDWTDTGSVVGKYFLSESAAIRVSVALTRASSTQNTFYDNPIDVANPDVSEPREISDTTSGSETDIQVGAGYEMRRGSGRLQGIFGGEAVLGMSQASSKTSYGWTYDEEAAEYGVIFDGSSRTTQSDSGTGWLLGARGFVGAEYFVRSGISISAEYGVGLAIGGQGRGTSTKTVWEVDDEGNGSTSTEQDETGSTSFSQISSDLGSFGADTAGTLTLNIHF